MMIVIHPSERMHGWPESNCRHGGAELRMSPPLHNEENSMSPSSLTKLAPVVLILAGSLGLGGCATKGYVNDQIATVNQRIDALDSRLQATDGTAKQALAEAQAASGQAQQNSQRIDQLNMRADAIEQRLQQRRRPRN
jgi:outer membrane murein-binding lipoprotein Lpp